MKMKTKGLLDANYPPVHIACLCTCYSPQPSQSRLPYQNAIAHACILDAFPLPSSRTNPPPPLSQLHSLQLSPYNIAYC